MKMEKEVEEKRRQQKDAERKAKMERETGAVMRAIIEQVTYIHTYCYFFRSVDCYQVATC